MQSPRDKVLKVGMKNLFVCFFSTGKESTCNVGDLGLIPGLERSPGGGKGYPLQYSGLENSMDYIAYGASLADHMVKRLPAMQETRF